MRYSQKTLPVGWARLPKSPSALWFCSVSISGNPLAILSCVLTALPLTKNLWGIPHSRPEHQLCTAPSSWAPCPGFQVLTLPHSPVGPACSARIPAPCSSAGKLSPESWALAVSFTSLQDCTFVFFVQCLQTCASCIASGFLPSYGERAVLAPVLPSQLELDVLLRFTNGHETSRWKQWDLAGCQGQEEQLRRPVGFWPLFGFILGKLSYKLSAARSWTPKNKQTEDMVMLSLRTKQPINLSPNLGDIWEW